MNLLSSLLLLVPAVLPAPAARAVVAVAPESVEEQLAAGRKLLDAGRLADALARFEAAAQQDGSLRTRQWILRTWIAQARVNDALDEIDRIAKTEKGPPVDYLYGMAFAQKAKGYIAEGAPGGIISMAFVDAIEYLQKATAADPVLYADAFAPLAESAWYGGQLDVARTAAEKVTRLRPKDGDAWHMLGRVAFSQYTAAQPDETRAAEAEAAWTAAREAFTKALECFAASDSGAAPAKGAEASMQLGWLHVWKQQGDEAAKRFGAALAVDPSAADYAGLQRSLSPEQYVFALEEAARRYEALHGKETQGDAALLWWLGYARYAAKQYEGAEAAFTRAVAKAPEFVNSWYYVALSRYFRQDYDGAIAGLRTHWGLSRDDATASIRSNQAENVRILEYMVGLKAAKAANLDAAFLTELLTAVTPDDARQWNNLGLFLRDEGDARSRRRREMSPEERQEIQDLYERSYRAYGKALELSPDDPNYLNDIAVVLDYNLDRDHQRARAWYVRAAELAEKELARKDLDRDTRALREIALRDARNNLKRLEDKLERRRKEQEAREAKEQAKEGAGSTPH
ncbi:MAG: hypothetical protein JNK02_08590 [Planctomycetes bacterium]|nr:hypothetical protein [Planctomycetota bacterium]